MTLDEINLTVIIVSYNTRDLTLKCLETLYATTLQTPFRCVLIDNMSKDGSADAVAEHFPQVELIRSEENLGFAKGNNVVAAAATTDWLLLLNPDTECHAGAVDNLMAFAQAHPEAGITGGRTVFADGSLNPGSCWMRITPWSVFCSVVGLTAAFPKSSLFHPEGMGGWERDTPREVDIVQGSFFMIPRKLWNDLDGFNPRYFMYGEEADMCLRAKAAGWKPMITPTAQIVHLAGASSPRRGEKIAAVARGRMSLMRDHWPSWQVPIGVALMWLWGAGRLVASQILALISKKRFAETAEKWRFVWSKRADWLKGY